MPPCIIQSVFQYYCFDRYCVAHYFVVPCCIYFFQTSLAASLSSSKDIEKESACLSNNQHAAQSCLLPAKAITAAWEPRSTKASSKYVTYALYGCSFHRYYHDYGYSISYYHPKYFNSGIYFI